MTNRLRLVAIARSLFASALAVGVLLATANARADGSEQSTLNSALIVDGLVAPIDIVLVPDGSGRRLILDQSGVIHWLSTDNAIADTPFLDIQDRLLTLEEGFEERGLLGFALHPQFTTNGRVFVTYTAPLNALAPGNWNYTRFVSEFALAGDDVNKVDPGTERVLIEQHWPSRKHNGGALAFGPDGYLYIGFGDGGGIHGVGPSVLNDAFNVPAERAHWDATAQDTHTLFGKILRIDVDHGLPGYAIPDDNPFAQSPGKAEIFAWGFRNPYRIAFDPDGNGSFYVTAVAETLWEAVYRVDGPGNYGWPLKEGTHCFDRQKPLDPPATCDGVTESPAGWPIIAPVVEYANMSVHRDGSQVTESGVGTAVVGAVMLRGSELPSRDGTLLVADWSLDFRKPTGQLFSARPDDGNNAVLWPMEKISVLDTRIIALSQDAQGRVYLLTNENFGPYGRTGRIYQLSE